MITMHILEEDIPSVRFASSLLQTMAKESIGFYNR